MGTTHRRFTPARWAIVVIAAAAAAAACTPPPTGGTTTTTLATDPVPPVIHAFEVKGAAGSAPAVVALGWAVSDGNSDQLTCRIDGDGDGSFEHTVTNCQVPGSRNATVAVAGSRTATIQVDDGTHPPVTATTSYTVGTGPTETLDIELRGLETLDPAVAAVFTAAVARWEGVITRGLPDYAGSTTPSCLPAGSAPLPAVVDDMIVDVSTPTIDGPGGILGQAGPTCVLLSTELGFHGIMQFDSADVAKMLADGTLQAVITHELGHVLGIGTLWDMSWTPSGVRRLLSGAGGSNPTFTGARGVAEYSQLGRTGSVPVENAGGPGTRDSHWRELTFGNELMTGYIDYSSNPLSRLSIASLADMGYHVDLGVADSYSLPAGAAVRQQQPRVDGVVLRPTPGIG